MFHSIPPLILSSSILLIFCLSPTAMLKRSLGYAYVNYHNQVDAERALETMNYTQIQGRPCRIMWSQRDPSLRKSGVGNIFVKSLHPDVHHKELQDTFSLFGNIMSCKVVLDADGKSKGYGYVHFETEEAAKAATERMEEIEICGQKVEVEIFQKKQHPNRANWTNLYAKNVPTHMTEADVRAMFEEFGEVLSMKLMVYSEEDVAKDAASAKPHNLKAGASKGFGFVSYAEHESAAAAAEALNGKKLPDPDSAARKKAAKARAAANGEATDDEEIDENPTRELYVGRAQKKEERQRELKKKFQLIREKNNASLAGVNLFVKNLEDSLDDKALDTAFKPFGTITSSRIMRNADGTSKGFGFVCFSSQEEANAASNEMNGKVLAGKPIYVAFAQRKEQRREMLSQTHMPRNGGMPGVPGRGPMPGMYGGVPMMYPGMPNRGGYAMPMMMPGGKGMPRGPAGVGPQFGRGQPYPNMPYQGGNPNMNMQQQPRQNNRGQRQNQNRQQQGPGGKGGAGAPNMRQPQTQNGQVKNKLNIIHNVFCCFLWKRNTCARSRSFSGG
jgi:polyadenylate-binding protein